jgi:hypothetical protein
MPSPRQGAMWPTWLSFNDEFKQLPHGCQWLFRLLWTHPDLNSGGFITLAPRAWSDCASDLDPAQVEAQLDGLLAMQHRGRPWVSVDDRTAELLVRPFIELDAQKKPHIYVSAMRAVQSCRSASLRADGWHEITCIHPPLLKRDPKKDPEIYDKLERDRDAAYYELMAVMEDRSERSSNRSENSSPNHSRTLLEPPSGDGPGSGDGDHPPSDTSKPSNTSRSQCVECGQRPAAGIAAWRPELCSQCTDALKHSTMRGAGSW